MRDAAFVDYTLQRAEAPGKRFLTSFPKYPLNVSDNSYFFRPAENFRRKTPDDVLGRNIVRLQRCSEDSFRNRAGENGNADKTGAKDRRKRYWLP
jgi:hypothetical protein